MSDEIRVNGQLHDYGSIKVKVSGEVFHGFTAVKYNHKRPRGKVGGTGSHRAPRGRSGGRYEVGDCSLTGPKSTMEALRESLDDGRGNYGSTEFLVTVEYLSPNDTAMLDELVECVIVEEDESHEETSNDVLMEEIKIDPMYIKKNGRTLFDNDGTR